MACIIRRRSRTDNEARGRSNSNFIYNNIGKIGVAVQKAFGAGHFYSKSQICGKMDEAKKVSGFKFGIANPKRVSWLFADFLDIARLALQSFDAFSADRRNLEDISRLPQ